MCAVNITASTESKPLMDKKIEKLYTISFNKLCDQSVGVLKYRIENVLVDNEKMDVFFCKSDKGPFVVAGKYRSTGPYRSCGHWHSSRGYYDIYFRKDFKTPEEGNAFYMDVKKHKLIGRSKNGKI